MTEYANRPMLVPPFIIITHALIVAKWIVGKFRKGNGCTKITHLSMLTKVIYTICKNLVFLMFSLQRQNNEIRNTYISHSFFCA